MNQQPEILLVEDNENDIVLTLHALQKERVAEAIHVARDGEEALEFLSARERQSAASASAMPRLILLDLKLPRVDGIQVLQAVKSNPVTQAIPVVVLTSSKHDQDLVRCYRLGANSYLQKPVDFDAFRIMVKQVAQYWLGANLLPSAAALRAATL